MSQERLEVVLTSWLRDHGRTAGAVRKLLKAPSFCFGLPSDKLLQHIVASGEGRCTAEAKFGRWFSAHGASGPLAAGSIP